MYSRATVNKRQIKIVITGGLGDVLLATPFVRHFAQSGAYDKVVCVVPKEAAAIFEHSIYVDQLVGCSGSDVMLWAVPEVDCDIFSPYMDVQAPDHVGANMRLSVKRTLKANQRQGHIVQQVAEKHGIQLKNRTLEIFTDRGDAQWAERYISQFNGKPVIFFNPTSPLAEKNLPTALSRKIVKRLQKEFIVLQLDQGDPPVRGATMIRPTPTIRQSAELFRRLFGLISVDSFPGHLARAVGTPAVVIFGPSNPATFGHAGNFNIRSDDCAPCADTPRKSRCRRSSCMEKISVDEVVEALFAVGSVRGRGGGSG